MPGTENTQFFEVEDRSGDAEAAEDDEKISVFAVVIIIFSMAILAAAVVFYMLYITEKRKKEKREAAKLAGSSRNSMNSQSNRNSGSNAAATSAAAAAANAELRQKEINEGLIVQIWGSEVHPSDDESKEDEESGPGSNKDTCPICRKAYEAGDEVCSSRSQACGHSFHKSCISNWLQYQARCPVCNTEYLPATATLS